ncbi:MAG TPA: GspE/PulE family protein [Verrucomicrobiae bacterium]|nr:GspE/PulE family protein [Verrucomicrobiae bacterium]
MNTTNPTELPPRKGTHADPTAIAGAGSPKQERTPPVSVAACCLQGREIRKDLAARTEQALAAASTRPEDILNHPDLARALVEDALAARASDIHLEPRQTGVCVRLRVDGAITDVASLTLEEGRWVTNQFKALANLDPVARFTPRDSHARVGIPGGFADLRLALAPCQRGEALTIRLFDPKRLERSIAELGLSAPNLQQLEGWLENVNGMFVAAGPTGSGKTTTVYGLLHELKYADRAVVSIEDPVEHEIPGITQVQLDEKHHLSFAEGVKSMLRLDPDFLMIGEIRDAASAHAAVDAAITGRVLLTTVHARDAVGVVTALRNWGLRDHEIAESLTVVVAQRLVRRLCPSCRRPGEPGEAEARWIKSLHLPPLKCVWSAPGCPACRGLGYHGRSGIFELWRLRESDYRLILAHADEHTLRRCLNQGRTGGLLEDGLAKVADGTTSLPELRRACSGALPAESLPLSEIAPAKQEPA